MPSLMLVCHLQFSCPLLKFILGRFVKQSLYFLDLRFFHVFSYLVNLFLLFTLELRFI